MDGIFINWFLMVIGFRLSVGSSFWWLKALNFAAALLQMLVILNHYKLI